MFTYACIATALLLALWSRAEYKSVAWLVFAEFAAHKAVFLLGYELTGMMDKTEILAMYTLVQAIIVYLIMKKQNHIFISSLILANLGYNMLTVAGIELAKIGAESYNFLNHHFAVVATICVIELLYLAGITKYANYYRRKYGYTSIDFFDRLFCIRRRVHDKALS